MKQNNKSYEELLKELGVKEEDLTKEVVLNLIKKMGGKNAVNIWDQVEQEDESTSGRIPTFMGEFTHPLTQQQMTLDDMLNGGYYRGQPVVISAFPNEGKTGYAVQSTFNQAKAGFRCLYITLEQTPKEIIEMALGHATGEHADEWEKVKFIQDDKAFNDKKQFGKKALFATLGDNFIVIKPKLDSQSIIPFIELIVDYDVFDVLVIDNFQNIPIKSDQKKFGSTFEQLDNVTRKVTEIIADTKTCLVWLSQLTMRGSEKVTKFSTKLNEDAATQLEIRRHRPKVDKDGNLEEPDDIAKTYIDVKKNRKGKDKEKVDGLTFVFDKEHGRMGSFNPHNLPAEQLQKHIEESIDERYKERMKAEQEKIKKGVYGNPVFDKVTGLVNIFKSDK